MTGAIMFQGTGSNVGKSLIVAGLCRAFARKGLTVRPFKPQNMSNNAAATADGGEIGRAQALQAQASFIEPTIDMNPVLLKPETESGAQIILQGKRLQSMKAREYGRFKDQLMPAVLESFERLKSKADLVIVEGAGSPAEINLRAGDIANMGFAEAANLPVMLIGDIDRGGVIASLVGTHAVLPADEQNRIKGFLINRFRGDVTLFDQGLTEITKRTNWPSLGIVPWFEASSMLPAEDSLGLVSAVRGETAKLKIVVPKLPRLANFDDLDPLRLEPNISLEIIEAPDPLASDADLVIITGSKATIADLEFMRKTGWDIDILAHHRQGKRILGLCGGYQMLGREIRDPDGIEGRKGTTKGLGLLDITTDLTKDKTTKPVKGVHCQSGLALTGYEIHLGYSTGPDCARPFARIDGREDGAMSSDGQVIGTYLHGVFAEDAFRADFLKSWGAASNLGFEAQIEQTLNDLADHLEASLDMDLISKTAGL